MTSIVISRLSSDAIPSVLKDCLPHLVFHPSDNYKLMQAKYVRDVLNILNTSPNDLQVLTAFDGQTLVGFSISNLEDTHVFISQFWSHSTNTPEITNSLFYRIALWAIANDRPSIRAETKRNVEVLTRRIGFKQRSVIVEQDLSAETFQKLVSVVKENHNGQPVSNTKS